MNLTLRHDDHAVGQRQRFLLVVGHVDKCDAQLFVHLLQFQLHVFAHLQVQCRQRFVQQQHFGFVDDSASNSHALLLTAGERVHVTLLIIGQTHGLQRRLDFQVDSGFVETLQVQAKSDVVEHVQVRKQRILLEHRVHRTFVRRHLRHILTVKQNLAFRHHLKTRYTSQQRRLAAARRAKNRYKLAFLHREAHVAEGVLTVLKLFGYVLYFNYHFLSC